jgi:hypothetical protein
MPTKTIEFHTGLLGILTIISIILGIGIFIGTKMGGQRHGVDGKCVNGSGVGMSTTLQRNGHIEERPLDLRNSIQE